MPYVYCEATGWMMPNCNWSTVQWSSQKLNYASSSWWGFATASDRQHLEGFLRRSCWQNLYSTDKPSITQIVEKADENLFNSIGYNPSHLLHQLLPRRTESSYSLRSRPHNFELSHIHNDRNFIDRMIFFIPQRVTCRHNEIS